MTNFSILYPESRLYWVQEGYLSAGSPGCAEGPGLGLECPGWAQNCVSGTGWALAIPINGRVAGEGSTQPPGIPLPGTHPVYRTPYTPPRTVHRSGGHAENSRFGPAQGDPRGRIRTPRIRTPRARLRAVSPLAPPYALRLSGPLPGAFSGISSYISVISQLYLSFSLIPA